MHTPFLVGLLFAFALTALGLATFYLRVWWRRRDERSFLHFGLLTVSTAAHCALEGLGFLHAYGYPVMSLSTLSRLVVVPSKLSAALLLHFALLYAGVQRPRRIMGPVYALMGSFALIGLAGLWWRAIPQHFETVHWLGFSVHWLNLQPTLLALPFYPCAVVIVGAAIVLLGRGLVGRAWGHGAFVGAIILGIVTLNELALALRLYPTVPLAPLGFLALAFGVALTLVSRYGDTSRALETRTIELDERSRQLDASYRDLVVAQQRLVKSEQLALVGELAAVIAHEVRNPLAVVGNAVASLRKRQTSQTERLVLLEIIEEEMDRLDKLVSRLLNYARPVVPKREAVDLEALIERSLAVVEREQGLSVGLRIPEGLDITIEGDADLLRQAFENVLTNAAQALEGKGTITIRVSAAGEDLAVSFEDDGEGMPEQALALALSPFFTTRPTGTGLGLPIVRRIAEAHGGHVEIESTLGEGTSVTIHLPRRPARDLPPAPRLPMRSLSVLP